MNVNNELLRVGIISKLKEYDAFIDNELPDYIMVMLANHKTIHQIASDLKLFLGANTERFTLWLQKVITNPELLAEKEEEQSVTPEQELNEPEEEDPREDSTPPSPPAGTKRRRSNIEVVQDRLSSEKEEDEKPTPPKMVKTSTEEYTCRSARGSTRTQLVKVVAGDDGGQRSRITGRKTVRTKPEPTRDQDLRDLIARRRGEKGMVRRKHMRREKEEMGLSGEEVEEGGEHGRTTVASVVRLVERPVHSNRGGSRLLQRAILGIGGRRGEKQEVKHLPVVHAASTQKGPKVKRSQSSGARRSTRGPASTASMVTTVASDHEEGEIEDEVEENFVDEFREEQQQRQQQHREEEEMKQEEEEEEEEEEEVSEKETVAIVTKKAIPVLVDSQKSHSVMGEVVKIEERDLRELLSKSKEDKSTRFVVTLDGVGDQYQHVDPSGDLESEDQLLLGNQDQGEEWEEDTGAVGRGSGMPERCRFWPNCKNGDSCPYHHPSAPCKLFPNCKYGNKCLFIHPQCKFDARCKRADCPYLHTAPRHLMFKQPQVPVPPVVFSPPPFKPPKNYSYSRAGVHQSSLPWQRSSKFPNKSALTWTPKKSSHISERQFAVPKEQTTSLQVT